MAIIIMFIIGIFLPILFSLPVEAKNTTQIEVIPYKDKIEPNENFYVTISLDPGEEVMMVEIDMSFNPSLLQCDGVSNANSGAWGIWMAPIIDNTAGEITGACVMDMVTPVTSPTDCFTITFTAQYTNGISPLDIHDVDMSDEYGTPISPMINNSSVTIDGGSDGDGNDDGNGNGGNNINIPPVANASASDSYGFVGESVNFDGSNSYDLDEEGYIDSWLWDFGDGSNGIGETTTHTYNNSGTYTTRLTVTDDFGDEDTCKTVVVITQPNIPPTTPTISGPTLGDTKVEYTYTAMSNDFDNDTIRYIFDWDDDTLDATDLVINNTVINATHTWADEGVYLLKVHAEDEHNATSSTAKMIVLIGIDVEFIDDEITGYLIDYYRNGSFTVFHNNVTGVETTVEQQNDGSCLIDSNNEGEWDYTYNTEDEVLQPYQKKKDQDEQEPLIPGFELVALLAVLAVIIFWKRKRKE